ncbi:MAG: hypothetical protein M9916_09890 [Crocinitomicaceae bacterium]|nr:hypothetical protein [Crocinitomicaceae bacterium]
MNVFITLDYELFFGQQHGTVEKTLLYPTNRLIEIGKRTGAHFTFFVDCGYLIKLKEYKEQYTHLENDYNLVINQLKELCSEGHDCQLHIHPHWEKTIYNGEKWVFDYNYYKLSDFSDLEIVEIFKRYNNELEQITGKKTTSYRAGGWCIQPFEKVKSSFIEAGITIDSSVFVGGKNTVEPYYYDYTTAPDKDFWHFDNDVCKEVKDGKFIELPISSYYYSPCFFWRLFLLGNLFPSTHKPLGDGRPMPSPNFSRRKLLTKYHFLSAGIEGYFVTKIERIIDQNKKKGFKNTVLLGHPKSLTHFSLKKLEKIIQNNKHNHSFLSFTEFYNEISG